MFSLSLKFTYLQEVYLKYGFCRSPVSIQRECHLNDKLLNAVVYDTLISRSVVQQKLVIAFKNSLFLLLNL